MLWFLILLFSTTFLPSAPDNQFSYLYFTEINEAGVPQLRVLAPDHSVSDVFPDNNDGFFSTVSPNGSYFAFVRSDRNYLPGSVSRLWIVDSSSGQTHILGDHNLAVGGIWSSDSRFFLLFELDAVSPMWAGYNYGYLSVYDVIEQRNQKLENIQAFALGWFPDNERILLWNSQRGYFSLNIVTLQTDNIEFDTATSSSVFLWGEISPKIQRLRCL